MLLTSIVPEIILLILLSILFLISGRLLGSYIHMLISGKISYFPVKTLESSLFRFIDINPDKEDNWKGYGLGLLIFNAIGLFFLFIELLVQGYLPLNPLNCGPPDLHIALNTAVSFVTNTNWQVYTPETGVSGLTQMLGLTVQNFLSAATGICTALALMRGFSRHSTDLLGNVWVDLIRVIIFLLIPIALIAAVILVSQGVIQNFNEPVKVTGFGSSGGEFIPMGPVASQESIKELGTNGGGYFNANSAHPFENPNQFTNLFEIFLILLITVSLPFVFGLMVGEMRQAWAIIAVMGLIFFSLFLLMYIAESEPNPFLIKAGMNGPSLEGKEVRFGIFGSVLFGAVTTATSCGAVNMMHDSLSPLAGLVLMIFMLLGEVIFGGVGSGFYTYIAFIVIAVFIAGLMIGRTPEYVGKKIGVFEMKMAVVTILTSGILVLLMTALTFIVPGASDAITAEGPHGLSQLIYAYASMANNNGSAFGGFIGADQFHAVAGSIVMLIGRYLPMIAILALAGSVAAKKTVPPGPGTLRTDRPAFIGWMILVILIIGVLTFFPLLALGPGAEGIIYSGGV